jgi:hypothetical protein
MDVLQRVSCPIAGFRAGSRRRSHTTFYPDGRYSGSSSGGAFGSFDSGGGYAVSNGDEDGGTYEVRDGLVIFRPAHGGQRRAMAAFRSGEHVLIGDQFLRRHRPLTPVDRRTRRAILVLVGAAPR